MKKLLIFLGGLVSGAVIGGIYMRGKILNDIGNLSKEPYRPKPFHVNKKDILEVVDFDPEKRKREPINIEKPELDQLVKKYRTEESNYEDYSKTSKDEDISEEPYPPEDYLHPEEDEDDEEPPEVEYSSPQIIPRLEFENEKTNYEVQTLMYYAYDDTVCDEQDQVISSPEDLIGDDALVCFGLGSDDPNTVYICNDKRGTKYEVIKVAASYQEQVLGMKDADLRFKRKDYSMSESDADIRFRRKDYLRREDSDTD